MFVLLLTLYALIVHRPNSRICKLLLSSLFIEIFLIGMEVFGNESIFTGESGNETASFIDCFPGTSK